jgi:hypothetical protein
MLTKFSSVVLLNIFLRDVIPNPEQSRQRVRRRIDFNLRNDEVLNNRFRKD